jgi:hypothetical protein
MNNDKERLYLTALSNFIKQKNFYELQDDFDRAMITEEEFDKSLTTEEHKYLIQVKPIVKETDAILIQEIVNDLGDIFVDTLTVDEVADWFGIETNSLNKALELKDPIELGNISDARDEYEKLKVSGMMWEFYPDLKGNWNEDQEFWLNEYTNLLKIRNEHQNK